MKIQKDGPSEQKGQKCMELCFGTISKGDRGRKYAHAIENCQCSIEVVASWVRFKELCADCEDEFRAVLKRDVLLMFVVEKPPKNSQQKPETQAFYRFFLAVPVQCCDEHLSPLM